MNPWVMALLLMTGLAPSVVAGPPSSKITTIPEVTIHSAADPELAAEWARRDQHAADLQSLAGYHLQLQARMETIERQRRLTCGELLERKKLNEKWYFSAAASASEWMGGSQGTRLEVERLCAQAQEFYHKILPELQAAKTLISKAHPQDARTRYQNIIPMLEQFRLKTQSARGLWNAYQGDTQTGAQGVENAALITAGSTAIVLTGGQALLATTGAAGVQAVAATQGVRLGIGLGTSAGAHYGAYRYASRETRPGAKGSTSVPTLEKWVEVESQPEPQPDPRKEVPKKPLPKTIAPPRQPPAAQPSFPEVEPPEPTSFPTAPTGTSKPQPSVAPSTPPVPSTEPPPATPAPSPSPYGLNDTEKKDLTVEQMLRLQLGTAIGKKDGSGKASLEDCQKRVRELEPRVTELRKNIRSNPDTLSFIQALKLEAELYGAQICSTPRLRENEIAAAIVDYLGFLGNLTELNLDDELRQALEKRESYNPLETRLKALPTYMEKQLEPNLTLLQRKLADQDKKLAAHHLNMYLRFIRQLRTKHMRERCPDLAPESSGREAGYCYDSSKIRAVLEGAEFQRLQVEKLCPFIAELEMLEETREISRQFPRSVAVCDAFIEKRKNEASTPAPVQPEKPSPAPPASAPEKPQTTPAQE